MQEMQETRVQSLGREDLLGRENGNRFQESCLENSMGRGSWWATVWGMQRVGHYYGCVASLQLLLPEGQGLL